MVALLIEETANQTESHQIKSNAFELLQIIKFLPLGGISRTTETPPKEEATNKLLGCLIHLTGLIGGFGFALSEDFFQLHREKPCISYKVKWSRSSTQLFRYNLNRTYQFFCACDLFNLISHGVGAECSSSMSVVQVVSII